MFSDEELSQFLPSLQVDKLSQAIGRRLLEVTRWFELDPAGFGEDPRFRPEDFFSYNSGPVQLDFTGGLTHVLDVWGEQLSIVLIPDELRSVEGGDLYRLSASITAPPGLKSCLGKTCRDVRIWTLREDIETEEARQAAVSYLLSNGSEMFYCVYLHGDLDSDYLVLGPDVPRQQVRSCFSLAQGGMIDPRR